MYKRKTKDIYILYYYYNGIKEEIDTAYSRKEANYLAKEYCLAYNSPIHFFKKRDRI